MQKDFGFAALIDIAWIRDRLFQHFGKPAPVKARTPIGQLVKSSISSRTRDEVSLCAYDRLVHAFPHWADLAAASSSDVEAIIADVTFADTKACRLGHALRAIAAFRADFDLTFLRDIPVEHALNWLEKLPGVGRKVAASTLNFSTLNRPAFVIDTHILRVLGRFGLVGQKGGISRAYDAVMEAVPGWSAVELSDLHIVMKQLGQTICRFDGPDCPACPIRQHCRKAVRPSAFGPYCKAISWANAL